VGINDLRGLVPVDTIKQNLTKIYTEVLGSSPNVKLIVNTIPPFVDDAYCDGCFDQITYDDVNAFIMSYDINNPRIFRSNIAPILGSNSIGTLNSVFNPGDQVHPNQKGCDTIAQILASIIINEDNLIFNCCDSDNDGVCDINDLCPGSDDNIDLNNNGVPDGCDPICHGIGYSIIDQIGINVNSTITKTSSTSWGNGGGATNVTLSEGEFITYQVTAGKATMVGLSVTNTNANYTSIDYALYSSYDNQLYVWEYGNSKTSGLGTYTAKDILKISIENGKVKYYKNDVPLVYESIILSPGNMVVDFAIYDHNAEIRNLQIVNCDPICLSKAYSVTNQIGITTTNSTITKTNSTDWGNGGGSTNLILSEGDYITYQVTNNKATMVGLSVVDTSANYTTINYALYSSYDNQLYVWEYGNSKTSGLGTYTANDILKILIENGKVKYYKNDIPLSYESTISSSSNLVVDFAMHGQNAEIENLKIFQCTNSAP
jgi:hypothetical protein